jgi:hypothetical protein
MSFRNAAADVLPLEVLTESRSNNLQWRGHCILRMPAPLSNAPSGGHKKTNLIQANCLLRLKQFLAIVFTMPFLLYLLSFFKAHYAGW